MIRSIRQQCRLYLKILIIVATVAALGWMFHARLLVVLEANYAKLSLILRLPHYQLGTTP